MIEVDSKEIAELEHERDAWQKRLDTSPRWMLWRRFWSAVMVTAIEVELAYYRGQ